MIWTNIIAMGILPYFFGTHKKKYDFDLKQSLNIKSS